MTTPAIPKIAPFTLDLSSLVSLVSLDSGTAPTSGTPLRVLLSDIIPDPDNPRTEYDEANLRELADNIRQRGVLEPVSLRSRNADGKHVLNSGWRRYLASQLAGNIDVPGFIDDVPDDFDRYNVNEARENLTALDRAKFIHKKRNAGLSLAGIGARMSPTRSKAFVQQHLALLELPAVLRALYDTGVCRNVTALYDLHRVFRKNAALVEQALVGVEEITGAFIKRLAQGVEEKVTPDDPRHHREKEDGKGGERGEGNEDGNGDSGSKERKGSVRPKLSQASQAPPTPPSRKAEIAVSYQGARYRLAGQFIISAVPSQPGFVWVCQGAEPPFEVDASLLQLEAIVVTSD